MTKRIVVTVVLALLAAGQNLAAQEGQIISLPQPRLPGGHPFYAQQPNIKCGATWFRRPDPNRGVMSAGWYKWTGDMWRPLMLGDCHENPRFRYSVDANGFYPPNVAAIVPNGHPLGANINLGIGIQAGVGITVPGGPMYPSQTAYANNGMFGGYYGLPYFFDFQVDELRRRYQDPRNIAEIKIKGEGCDSDCLRSIRLMVRMDGRWFRLVNPSQGNNWWEKPIKVPVGTNGGTELLVVRQEAGKMRGYDASQWLATMAQTKDPTPFAISHAEFTDALELKILDQRVEFIDRNGNKIER